MDYVAKKREHLCLYMWLYKGISWYNYITVLGMLYWIFLNLSSLIW